MYRDKKVIVVMPAYNAEQTLRRTHEEVMAQDFVDGIIVVDDANSDDFVFDNQVLAQITWLGYVIAEVSCPTRYAPDASSINFARSVRYGFGCLLTAVLFKLAEIGLIRSRLFPRRGPTRGSHVG